MGNRDTDKAIKTIEYMLARCPYNEAQRDALDTALIALKFFKPRKEETK